MHKDELRTSREIERLRVAEESASTEQLNAKYQTAQENGIKSRKQADSMQKVVRDLEARFKENQSQIHDLKRRVSEAHAALAEERHSAESLKQELVEVKKKITDLRNSRTMKAGRAVSWPLRALRGTSSNLDLTGKLQSSQAAVKNLVPKGKDSGTTQSPESSSASAPSSTGTPSTAPVAQETTGIRAKIAKVTPTKPKSWESQLNEAWYREGSIAKSRDIVDKNRASFSKASEKAKVLADRVDGAYRITQGSVSVPERAEGCSYLPEPGRIMYTVHSTPVFNSNGYSTRTRGVANGIKAAGGDVVVVGRSGYPWDSASDIAKPVQARHTADLDGITYVHTPGGNLNRQALDQYILKSADSFVREARMIRPSLIQSASNHRTALASLIAARRVGVPFVYEVRGLWELTEASAKPGFENSERFHWMKELETTVARQADVVLAITLQVADELVKRGVPRERIKVTPNAVDPHRFLPIPKDKEYAASLGIDPELPTIGFAGSIVTYEGLDLLVEASKQLIRQGVKHQVLIAGSGNAEAALKEQAGSDSAVEFLGRLPQQDMPRLMSLFDFAACPRVSSVVTEMVSPLKPLESFASNIPTVLSDVAPHRDLAGANKERALLFPAGDASALAEAFRALIEKPELAQDLGRNARLWVVRERNWNALGASIRAAHQNAFISAAVVETKSRPMSELRVALIADEFTTASLEGDFIVESLERSRWKEQFEASEFDLLFVESAWSGNDGQWHRGVGFYSDEESQDLRELISLAREKGVPSLFWNKEDPVHFSRFAPNAALFDHVSTTDANMVEKYFAFPGNRNLSVSAAPFWAQPEIHNPLPVDMEYRGTVAYAGTYYGDRYKERSANLNALLVAADPYGLEIYDRQANNPDSPYKFPERFQSAVQGALSHIEVIKSYKSHFAHLNVNSVLDSPTMFSRRVVEIPACGGVVLSAGGRGVGETLGSTIAASRFAADFRAFLHDWSIDSEQRVAEIRQQMRTVYRSHTSRTALSILLRTVGLNVAVLGWSTYGVRAGSLSESAARALAAQSLRPKAVELDDAAESVLSVLEMAGIGVVDKLSSSEVDFVAELPDDLYRTYFEDLLVAQQFGQWDFIEPVFGDLPSGPQALVEVSDETPGPLALVRATAEGTTRGLRFRMAPGQAVAASKGAAPAELPAPGTRVLVAGHDLKFARGLISAMQEQGLEVDIDQWKGHNQHDEAQSREKLQNADVVFCEWGLGNAVWYSKNVQSNQKLVVRAHSQELFLPYLKQINRAAVSTFIFVGELIEKAAVISHGIPEDKCVVIPNPVDVKALDLPKSAEARHTLGFVGMVPQSKRIDRALDVLEELLAKDSRYKLRIKGKTPNDYPWMKNRPEELKFFDAQMERAEKINAEFPDAVVFDEFGSDMEEWYSKVGVALSVSDFESFHLTLADGAASGAKPVSLDWPGADLIYPDTWLSGTLADLIDDILEEEGDTGRFQEFASENFGAESVYDALLRTLS